MTRNNLRDALFGCPVCRHRLLHLLYCARRHNHQTCRCVVCAAWRAGYLSCAVDDVRLKHLADAGFTAEQAEQLARIRREAA